jgi:WhiB family redox-sensing transcriptional regulator
VTWLDRGACRGLPTQWWFPPAPITPESTEQMHDAKRICSTCAVQPQCLDYGLGEDYGIWGGLSPKQRQRLRKESA